MTGKTINLNFEGYWREAIKSSVPSKSGIYCVYACTHNANDNPPTVSIRELIYIGESENVHNRIANHDRLGDWQEHLIAGETLCYSFAAVPAVDRVRAEAALINYVVPPENTEYTGVFTYNETTITDPTQQ
ncbi:GIY-YIG nuclease family protein [Pectobacterium carotovorum]|uniref:GIY-YIG nuclease family protein n=1 Tax=Pectobacterium brasiliense TaxID=180957 RepID=UPI000B95D2EC|nr:GIY-YIG nuclease family protein [Pectobacterium carotovorum]OYN53737.1 hypothetical protein B7L52_17655 [Pectobacterium carotovorum]